MAKKGVTFVLFGGTGDLTRRKLAPAFVNLVDNEIIGRNSTIIGVSRKKMSDEEYKKFLLEGFKDTKSKAHVENLKIKYLQGDFSIENGLKGLKELIRECEVDECDRIFYLATSYIYFPSIIRELKNFNLYKQKDGFTKVVFEKPFGSNLKSAEKLDRDVHKIFSEKDIFRLDHYLAKETVQNLNVLKFTNPILYGSFGNRVIESIDIIVDENLGVGNRISYYNNAGAIKDVIQSHLLQILSLLLMERPESLFADHIHDKKVIVLKNIEVMPAEEHLLGQYKSYSDELRRAGLAKSRTETFARIVLNCKMERWNGVKLVLRTGKKLKKKLGQIRINYKQAHQKFIHGFKGVGINKLVINVYPKQDIVLYMNSRIPEKLNSVEPVNFEFSRESKFGPNTSDEYAVLLEEVIKRDKTLFTRDDEIKESWKIIDKIEKMKSKIKFVYYEDGWNGD